MGLKAAIDLDQICVRLRRSRSGSYWRVERLGACRVWVALKKIPSDFAKRDEIGVVIAADA
jgi:hypothetical protein